jgi:hypothetical protein
MNIKNLKPNSKSGFRQGYYNPMNPQKYIANGPIIYRSSWEKKFCHWCDHNPDVISWVSEPFSIKYYNILDKKFHNYFPDFYIKMKKDGVIEEYLVEIKPKSQLKKPEPPKRNSKKAMENFKYGYETFVRNLCKTDALNKVAKQRNYKVMLLTEDTNLF